MTECISQFFHDADMETTNKKEPHNITAEYSLNSSQELSQESLSEEELSLSQLTIEEQEALKIQPFFNMTPREIPLSPHYIFEEEFSTNPWALLIATIFLTKTRGRKARRYMKRFFEEYPTPYNVLAVDPVTLEKFFDNLGLKKRGHMIWKLSYQFVSAKWRRASDLHGIGKYGEDAYRLFCLGHTDLDPGDRYLKLYLHWLRSQTDYIYQNVKDDSESLIKDPVLKYYKISLRDSPPS